MFKTVKEPAVLISVAAFNTLILLFSITMFVFGKIIVGIVLFILFLLAGFFVVMNYLGIRKELTQNMADDIMCSLKESGLNKFDLDEFKTYGKKSLFHACEEVYERCAIKALQDYIITDKENKVLDILRGRLELTEKQATQIKKRAKQKKYKNELESRLADGIITKKEKKELQELRQLMGLSERDAIASTKEEVVDGYNTLFRRFAQDGILTDEEFDELENYAEATGLSPDEAAKISKKEAISLYRRTVAMICQDGEVTDKEKTTLNRLEKLLKLSNNDISSCKAELQCTVTLSNIRKGNLPRVKTDAMLDSTEICHWESVCSFKYTTSSGNYIDSFGVLYVTNQRIIFNSQEKAFEFKPRKIIGITAKENYIELSCSTRVGQGLYAVENSDILGAILDTLVRCYSQEIIPSDQDRSRKIPDHVKVEVWQRDGGVCVKCGAKDYLEYDHIIPFSKGGANTGKNVQLLCRRCNLKKGSNLL